MSFDVVGCRRDLHAHPELSFAETRTTELIVRTLRGFGLAPEVLPVGTGVVCDVGTDDGRTVALRADIDALPLPDRKDVPYRSTYEGRCHGCGHDAHTAILLGVAEALVAEPPVGGRIRLIFQPAEESVPGGALSVVNAGLIKDVERIFALHCDPRIQAGQVGVRTGPITAACDHVAIALSGPGGHTARPHLTVDLVHALGRLITDVPALLSRRVDPRAGMSLVWGAARAGDVANAIPMTGTLSGTIRVLDGQAWQAAEPLIRELVADVLAPTGAKAQIDYTPGVPPVVNDAESVQLQAQAVTAALGPSALTSTEQSLGGEDFAWYLQHVPGALARLGVRTPGAQPFDLHQGTFDIDESALEVGVQYTVALARAALAAD